MFLGIDHDINRSADVYFNIFYQEMDHWLRGGLPRMQLGQASDEFKARLGCNAIPLFCYVKVTGLLRPIVMANIDSLFPPPKPWQRRDIFKQPEI